MQAKILIECKGCNQRLGWVDIDTADMPEDLQIKINKVLLIHREDCYYYRTFFVKMRERLSLV